MAISETGNTSSSLQMDYMMLLVAQLQNQNPMEPMSNEDMSMQLTQLSQLEQLENMSSSFQQVMEATDRSTAATLIGKTIKFFAPGAYSESAGRVSSVEIINGEARLQVGTIAQYTADGEAVEGSTTVDQFDQVSGLSASDTITVYGYKGNGETIGDGQGVAISLDSGSGWISMDQLLASITNAYNVDGEETYRATLVDGEIRLFDQNDVYQQYNMLLDYKGEGTFQLSESADYLPSLADITSITD